MYTILKLEKINETSQDVSYNVEPINYQFNVKGAITYSKKNSSLSILKNISDAYFLTMNFSFIKSSLIEFNEYNLTFPELYYLPYEEKGLFLEFWKLKEDNKEAFYLITLISDIQRPNKYYYFETNLVYCKLSKKTLLVKDKDQYNFFIIYIDLIEKFFNNFNNNNNLPSSFRLNIKS